MNRTLLLPTIGLSLVALAGCTENKAATSDASGAGGPIAVTATDTECQVATTSAPAGNITFSVTNQGSKVTEFYLLQGDGQTIMGEAENIGPGLTRDLVIAATAGTYFTNCKPGMTGDGIQAAFTVTESGSAAPTANAAELASATEAYAVFVRDQAKQLLAGTKEFAAAYKAGDFDQARALYAPTRMFWERIEPVAESFGDLDPKLDLREADLEEGQVWTGWHKIEKDLWPPAKGYTPLTEQQRTKVADQLVADTQTLFDRVQDLSYRADQLGNGAKELLDEVATGKVTGEEEIWSHTDLYDFQANVEGAREAYELLKPVVEAKAPRLATVLDERFEALQTELDKYRDGDGFVSYTDLTKDQVKQLAQLVDALSEPLAQLTAVVVQ